MGNRLNIAFFASSLVSAYWNGAATYYRGIVRALHERGHRVTFFEPDAFDRQRHRDIDDPPWANVVVYDATEQGVETALDAAKQNDVIIKASGVGVFDEMLEQAVPDLVSPRQTAIYWDVDAPATLDRIHRDPADPMRAQIPRYDLVLTYGGGQPVIDAYEALNARRCVPIYNALDAHTHHPVEPCDRFAGDLAFLGNRLPDREQRVETFFFEVAARLPDRRFVLGGNGWQDKTMPPNVHYVGHVYTRDHNAFNCSPRAVLNISRESMARYGYSPATRVFEAAGAGACIITDAWAGIDCFFQPGCELLVARSGEQVADHLRALTESQAARIGAAAHKRVCHEHTYAHRVRNIEALLRGEAGEPAAAHAPITASRTDGAIHHPDP